MTQNRLKADPPQDLNRVSTPETRGGSVAEMKGVEKRGFATVFGIRWI